MWKTLQAPGNAALSIILDTSSCSFPIIKFLCDLFIILIIVVVVFLLLEHIET